jgi:hypothetical protein
MRVLGTAATASMLTITPAATESRKACGGKQRQGGQPGRHGWAEAGRGSKTDQPKCVCANCIDSLE